MADIEPGDLVLITNLETGATVLTITEQVTDEDGPALRFVPVIDPEHTDS
jgi:hypothetical protein